MICEQEDDLLPGNALAKLLSGVQVQAVAAPTTSNTPTGSHALNPEQPSSTTASQHEFLPERSHPGTPTLEEDAGAPGADDQAIARKPHRLHCPDGGGARLARGQKHSHAAVHGCPDGCHRAGQHLALAVKQRAVLKPGHQAKSQDGTGWGRGRGAKRRRHVGRRDDGLLLISSHQVLGHRQQRGTQHPPCLVLEAAPLAGCASA